MVKYGLITLVLILIIGGCIFGGIMCLKYLDTEPKKKKDADKTVDSLSTKPLFPKTSPTNPLPPPYNNPKEIKYITGTKKVDGPYGKNPYNPEEPISNTQNDHLQKGLKFDDEEMKFQRKSDDVYVAPHLEFNHYKETNVTFHEVKDGDDYYDVHCPYCGIMQSFSSEEINCRIFRCGVQKKEGETTQINPHAKKRKINKLLRKGKLLYGCGGAYKVVGEEKENKVAVTVSHKS